MSEKQGQGSAGATSGPAGSRHGLTPRALTARELEVLTWVIERGAPFVVGEGASVSDRARWLAQLPTLRVAKTCGCGTCPTITLVDAEAPTSRSSGSRPVSQASADGAMLLLFVDDDGQLSELELAPLSDDKPFLEFPAPAGLRTR